MDNEQKSTSNMDYSEEKTGEKRIDIEGEGTVGE